MATLPIFVTGHQRPDTDSIASAIALAELRNHQRSPAGQDRYQAVRLGEISPQTSWVLKQAKAEPPILYDGIFGDETPQFILVDHSEVMQSVPNFDQVEIVEILDHHSVGSVTTKMPIRALWDPVGATATLVTEEFQRHLIEPTKKTATLLMAAILADTVILKSPTTTHRDEVALHYLEDLTGLEGESFGRKMFEVSTDVSHLSASEIVAGDAKEFRGVGRKFFVAHLIVCDDKLLSQLQELLEALEAERLAQGVPFYGLMMTNILTMGTKLLIAGELGVRDAVARAFGKEPASIIELPGVSSRKLQVVPPLMEVF